MKRHSAAALAILLLAGCADRPEQLPVGPSFGRLPAAGARGVTVMTRNVYIGVDLDPVLGASTPDEFFAAVATAWGMLQVTNFPARAGALADEIAATNPHLVGLQEVALYRTGTLGDPGAASDTAFDFLELLLDALAARGLSYTAAAAMLGTDLEVPNPVYGIDARFTDRDVILARSDVVIHQSTNANFAARIPLTVLGAPAGFLVRNWNSVWASVAGNTFRFVNTHLEVQAAAVIQVPQAQELLATLSTETVPIILVGDFNSAADGSQTPTYGMITAAGYVDTWGQKHPRDPGYTCCHDPTLTDPAAELDQRIDIIWARGMSGRSWRIVGGVHADIVGDDPAGRTAGGLWPSDHAGVVATLTVPPAQAIAGR